MGRLAADMHIAVGANGRVPAAQAPYARYVEKVTFLTPHPVIRRRDCRVNSPHAPTWHTLNAFNGSTVRI